MKDGGYMKENLLKIKSYAFALKIIDIRKKLIDKREYTLSDQVLRSGTSIGALVREAEFAQSRADFVNKMSIALKEANETEYWLSLLKDSDIISVEHFNKIHRECISIIGLLVSSIKTAKSKIR